MAVPAVAAAQHAWGVAKEMPVCMHGMGEQGGLLSVFCHQVLGSCSGHGSGIDGLHVSIICSVLPPVLLWSMNPGLTLCCCVLLVAVLTNSTGPCTQDTQLQGCVDKCVACRWLSCAHHTGGCCLSHHRVLHQSIVPAHTACCRPHATTVSPQLQELHKHAWAYILASWACGECGVVCAAVHVTQLGASSVLTWVCLNHCNTTQILLPFEDWAHTHLE
jgi:hypothetical protein